jgi:hypothetical protein
MTNPANLPAASGPLRDAAVDALSDAFAQDVLSVEEFERRVELAHRAETAAELRSLLEDLPLESAVPAPRAAHSVRTPAAHIPEQGVVVGFLGGGVRKGRWSPARYNYAVGVLGGAELDFRDCALPPVTDVRCFAIMGGVDVVVPPDVIVETSGVGILGGFDHMADADEAPAGAPVIRITGVAFMGGVSVRVRQPGESAGEARKRRRIERKERRRLKRGR